VINKVYSIPILFLIFVTLWLRLVNLGYSDYQGDEIRAMWRPASGQGGLDYLFAQTKGPAEYLVSYLVKRIDPDYSNELLLRLPFSLAGILGITFFYRLVELHYGRKIALYSTLLLSINGIFVGLMRIAQYQPFVILFSILTLYFFSLAIQQERWNSSGIYLGVLAWTAALFSHYDGLFIAPFAIYLLYLWYRKNTGVPVEARIKTLSIPAIAGALLLAAYFVPFFLSASANTTEYWLERFSGEDDIALLRSSMFTFKLYNPILALYLYAPLGALSLVKWKKALPVIAWFAIPWVIMEAVLGDPGTHIYTYLMPAVILVAFGMQAVEEGLKAVLGSRWGILANAVWLALAFAALASISHLIFVDHTPEYPFEKRGIWLWTIGGQDKTYRQWVFGFPYYRRWEEIRDFVTSSPGNGYYATNEKTSLSGFYIPYNSDLDRAGVYIYVHNPQSFRVRDMRAKVRYWREHYPPVKVFESNGRVIAEVYDLPPGTLKEIKQAGY
jgi:hypothetical protein